MLKLVLACLTLLTGCSLMVANPEVMVKDINVVGLDAGGVGMELYLAVNNPNPFEVKLMGYSYDLKVLAMPLAMGGARQELIFPAKATTEIRLPVHVAYGDMVEILKRQPDPERIPYQLQAGFDLDTPVGALAIPFEKTGTYAISEEYRPSYYLKQISDVLGEFIK